MRTSPIVGMPGVKSSSTNSSQPAADRPDFVPVGQAPEGWRSDCRPSGASPGVGYGSRHGIGARTRFPVREINRAARPCSENRMRVERLCSGIDCAARPHVRESIVRRGPTFGNRLCNEAPIRESIVRRGPTARFARRGLKSRHPLRGFASSHASRSQSTVATGN